MSDILPVTIYWAVVTERRDVVALFSYERKELAEELAKTVEHWYVAPYAVQGHGHWHARS